MAGVVELTVDLWMFGLPVVAAVWSLLRLLRRWPARLRYLLILASFPVALALPLAATIGGRNPLVVERAGSREPAPVLHAGAAGAALAARAATPLWIVWAGGALLLLLRDAVGHARLRRERHGWVAAPESLKRELEWPPRVPLSTYSGASPLTVGLLRPRVVIPRGMVEEFPLAVVRRIALHELSHARWRDPMVYAALRAVTALFWVAPVWPLLRWARREREAAADERALRGTAGEQEGYVAALVHCSRLAMRHRRLVPAMAASDLEYRARRILGPQPPRFSIAAVVVIGAAAVLLSRTVPANFAPRPASADRAEAPPAVHAAAVAVPVPGTAPRRIRRPRRPAESSPPVLLPGRVFDAVLLAPSRPATPTENPSPDVARHQDVDRHADVHRDDGDRVIVIRDVIVTPRARPAPP
jgi:beta-lactamase regulating signal transducer with metallopeptidase domain